MRKATLIALLVSTFSLLLFPMSANAASIGALTQPSGTSGCISESGTDGSCVDGNQLGGAGWLALSPDGNYLYVASFDSSAVTTFSRNLATGALTQLNTIQGCIAEVGDGITCADGRGLSGAVSLAVSPDGNHLYVASRGNSVAIFARNINTGVLSQLSGPAGCIAEVGDGVSCADGKALVAPRSIAVSPDGKSVYVTGRDSNAVAIFSRNATTGALTQLSGTAGCVSNDGTGGSCALGIGLSGARGVTVSPDSLHVYVASQNGNTLAIFSRNPTTGALTQLGGTAGCIAENGGGITCADGNGLVSPITSGVSLDGKHVYVASRDSSSVTIFSRNPTTGALTQLAGTAGCIAENGDGITCADGRGLSEAVFVTVSPDGNNVYAVSELSNALVAFARDALTGQLTQLTGLKGCVSETGAAGTPSITIELQWVDNSGQPGASDQEDNFNIYRCIGSGCTNFIKIASVLSNVVKFTDTIVGDTGGATYRYRVTAQNKAGESGPSNIASKITPLISTIPGAPTCADGKGLNGPIAVIVSPDGFHTYVASYLSNAVTIFHRQ